MIGDANLPAREQIEIVACRMILEADALRQAMRPEEEATAIYEKVVRLFPDTRSAQTARERLGGGAEHLNEGGFESRENLRCEQPC